MLRALLFDMDGVLVDSEDLSITIGMEYFATKGKKLSKKDFMPHIGTGMKDFFSGTAADHHIEGWSLEEADAFSRREYEAKVPKVGIAMDGAARILESARRSGLLVAICSSAPKWKVDVNIRALGFEPSFFDLVVTGEDIRRNKPHGDIYALALAKLGVDSRDALVFEDSYGGIKAGIDAGARTVGLATSIDAATAAEAGADVVISDIGAIPPFSSADELESFLFFPGDVERRVRYGVNMINPLEKRLPESVIIEKAIKKAAKARENAHVPYSHFKVGAAVVSAATGRIYSGCNVENSSYGGTICAERNAITSAVSEEGRLGIDLLVVVSDDDPPAPPCALCLQVIAEFSKEDTRVVLVDVNGKRTEYLFRDLLPHPFIMPALR